MTSAMCPVVFQKDYYESVTTLCPSLIALDGHRLRHKTTFQYPNFIDFDRNIEEKLQSLKVDEEPWISKEESELTVEEVYKCENTSLHLKEAIDGFEDSLSTLEEQLASGTTVQFLEFLRCPKIFRIFCRSMLHGQVTSFLPENYPDLEKLNFYGRKLPILRREVALISESRGLLWFVFGPPFR